MAVNGQRTVPFAAAEPEVPVVRTFHSPNGSELHFRYIGLHEGRHFVVNVQMPTVHESTGERLSPEEYQSVVAHVLQAVVQATEAEESRS